MVKLPTANCPVAPKIYNLRAASWTIFGLFEFLCWLMILLINNTVKTLLLLLTCASLMAQDAQPVGAESTQNESVKYAETISAADLQAHVYMLASDGMQGRETGKEGQKLAARYISRYFYELGLPKLDGLDEGYFQRFPLVEVEWDEPSISVGAYSFEFMKGFYAWSESTQADTFTADEIIYLGYGIDEENYSDYEGKDLEGKIILIEAGEPRDQWGNYILSGTVDPSDWSLNWKKKLLVAAEKGVRMVLVIEDNFEKNVQSFEKHIHGNKLKLESEGSNYCNAAYISRTMYQFLAVGNENKIEKAKERIKLKKKPKSVRLKQNITINFQKKEKKISSENILGFIEGTDKKDELLVLTAHYDHLGTEGELIYNGADDDASGVAAILEIGEAFKLAAQNGKGPRRSILILPVSAEEKGLLGSKYYADNPYFDLDQTIANLNIDMIGRIDPDHEDNPEYIYIIGSNRLSTELHEINEEANELYSNLTLDYKFNSINDPNRYYYRSDHYNFVLHDIPAIFYFNGSHEDYHMPTDTAEKINFDLLEKRTKLIFHTAWILANQENRIKADKVLD